MNNQQRKLFNIATKVEKLLYEHCTIIHFSKEMNYRNVVIDSGRKTLNWEFIEAFTDLTKKEDINFYIQYNDDKYCLQIKIWI